MTFIVDLLAVLAFRSRAVRKLSARRDFVLSFVIMTAGLLLYAYVRNSVYGPSETDHQQGFLRFLFQFNIVQALLFLSVAYVPALICLTNTFAGDGLGFSFSREEYHSHLSVLFPLWGVLLLLTAPIQWVAPGFVALGPFEIGSALLVLLGLTSVYTVWILKELDSLETPAALAVYVLSGFTLPLFFLLSRFVLALPFFILIPILYVLFQRFRGLFRSRGQERDFQRHLHTLTVNPQDSDAHYQLGLVHLKRRNLDAAERYFQNALRVAPQTPDFHYHLGRVFEERADWARALEQYEETFRLDPGFAVGDVVREVGKGYLHAGRSDKAIEFLQFFLRTRESDPEARYWLAVALGREKREEEARAELDLLLERVRSNPRFFRKENRRWIQRARSLRRQRTL